MTRQRTTGQQTDPLALLQADVGKQEPSGSLGDTDWALFSLVAALLDAHLLLGEPELRSELLEPLFGAYWPERSLPDAWAQLVQRGLVHSSAGGIYQVPTSLRRPLTDALDRWLAEQVIDLPAGEATRGSPTHAIGAEGRPSVGVRLADLMVGFANYCQEQLDAPCPAGPMPAAWGGSAWSSAGNQHVLLFRPFPLRLEAHADLYTMVICRFPAQASGMRYGAQASGTRYGAQASGMRYGAQASGTRYGAQAGCMRYGAQAGGLRYSGQGDEVLTGIFVQKPAVRQRVALYDLDQGQKMNLTRSDVFIHFERYLRWVHRLRVVPSPALTQSLLDSGLLVLEKA
jgi:hypothetical protein